MAGPEQRPEVGTLFAKIPKSESLAAIIGDTDKPTLEGKIGEVAATYGAPLVIEDADGGLRIRDDRSTSLGGQSFGMGGEKGWKRSTWEPEADRKRREAREKGEL